MKILKDSSFLFGGHSALFKGLGINTHDGILDIGKYNSLYSGVFSSFQSAGGCQLPSLGGKLIGTLRVVFAVSQIIWVGLVLGGHGVTNDWIHGFIKIQVKSRCGLGFDTVASLTVRLWNQLSAEFTVYYF